MRATERTHVALLRGVNVGGRNKVPMPVLREAVESLGHQRVETYVQSGNVVFAARQPDAGHAAIARSMEAVIAERSGVRPAVIVVPAAELARVIRDNPFPGLADPRLLHAVFLPEPPGEEAAASVVAAAARAGGKGSRDDVRLVGRVLYLSTPDGFARSVLRAELDRGGARRTPMSEGTARNWATVTALTRLVRG